MTRDQFGIDVRKTRRYHSEKLPRDVFSRRRKITKRRIVFIQELVIELFVDDFARTFLDFTNVDQHSGDGIDPAAENEIRDVIATRAVMGCRFRTKCSQVFPLAPFWNEQSS